ncbi:hypothetical protein BIW11_11774, partial [Tropilaelaps mercedesae]
YRAQGFPNHTILALTTLEHSISVTWKVDNKNLPWSIVYRLESVSPYAMRLHNRTGEGPHSSADDAIFTDVIKDLESESRYVVCAALAVAEGSSRHFEMDPTACQAVNTKGPRHNFKDSQSEQASHNASSLFMPPMAEKRRVSQWATTQLLAMRGGQRSIWVRWRLKVVRSTIGSPTLYRTRRDSEDDLTSSREWIVLTRKLGTGNFSEVRVSDTSGHSKDGNVYNYTVPSLTPDTAYDCCLMPVDTLLEDTMADRNVPGGLRDIPVHLRASVEQTLMMCKEIVTVAENFKHSSSSISSFLDGSSLIVVVAASAFITAVIVAALRCCCPASRLTMMYSEWENMPSHSQAHQRPRRARSEVRALPARPFTSLGNVCATSREDPFRTMRSLGNRQKMMGSDGGSYNDTTSSEDDRKILNAQSREIQRNKTTINWANEEATVEDSDGSGAVAYLDGRKVQVFGLGVSKTLPKSILRKSARPLAHESPPVFKGGAVTRVAGRSAARTQSHHARSFKKPVRSPPVIRRSSHCQNPRLNFCAFGKETTAHCVIDLACSACALESQSVASNSDNCSSTKHLCAHSSTTSSDCEVFIEHV